MKKLVYLFALAFLFINCSNLKDSKTVDKPDDNNTKNTGKKEKKKSENRKNVLEEHFEDKSEKEISREDKSGWPEERQNELRSICLQEAGDLSKQQASAYCICQLNNLMKIFVSYKEAMSVFNKTEEELSEEERNKLMMMESADENCIDQFDHENGDEENYDDESRMEERY